VHFTTPLTLLSIISTGVSATAADMGAWNITLSRFTSSSGYEKQDVTAYFNSASYPQNLKSQCVYTFNPAEVSASHDGKKMVCEPASFGYEWSSGSKSRKCELGIWDVCANDYDRYSGRANG
jgi:hypothetical protein